MADLRIGLKLAPQFTSVEELREVWRVADDAGFDHVWNFDHFASIREVPTGDVLEAYEVKQVERTSLDEPATASSTPTTS